MPGLDIQLRGSAVGSILSTTTNKHYAALNSSNCMWEKLTWLLAPAQVHRQMFKLANLKNSFCYLN
jgi:hypothetical protein